MMAGRPQLQGPGRCSLLENVRVLRLARRSLAGRDDENLSGEDSREKCWVFTSEVQGTNKEEYVLVGMEARNVLASSCMGWQLSICSLCINETPDSFRCQPHLFLLQQDSRVEISITPFRRPRQSKCALRRLHNPSRWDCPMLSTPF